MNDNAEPPQAKKAPLGDVTLPRPAPYPPAQDESPSEEALMSAYCAGDRSAFDRLFTRLGPRVHGFFMRSFQDRAVADDLLQTTFLKLHRARADFRAGEPVRPWLFSIAARVRLDEYRRRKHPVELLDEESLGHIPGGAGGLSAADGVETAERAEQVRAALEALPESQRVIVHLHRFEGLTFAQIAAALGTTEGAVKLRAFRAYEKLRVTLRPLVQAHAQAHSPPHPHPESSTR